MLEEERNKGQGASNHALIISQRTVKFKKWVTTLRNVSKLPLGEGGRNKKGEGCICLHLFTTGHITRHSLAVWKLRLFISVKLEKKSGNS
jgi:hypothetical protein